MVGTLSALSSISSAYSCSSLLFAVTAGFSIYGVLHYRKNGSLLEYAVQDAEHLPVEDHDYSADTSDKLNDHENLQLNHANEASLTHTNTEEQTHPSGPIAWNLQQPHTAPAELGIEPVDTSYNGGGHPYGSSHQPQSQPTYQYSAHGSRYDMHHSNESHFVGGLPVQSGGGQSRHNLAQDYDHGGYGSSGTVDFPHGDYSR